MAMVLAAQHWSLVAGDWHSIGGREFVAELSANSVSEIDIDLWEMQAQLARQLVAHVGGARVPGAVDS